MDTTPDEEPRAKKPRKDKKKPKSLAQLRALTGIPEMYVGSEDNEYRAKSFAIKALAKCGVGSMARRMTGVTKKTWDFWLVNDPAFAEAVGDALEYATDELEHEARKRAMKQSDYLLVTLLKANRPEKFRETIRNEHTGKEGGPMELELSAKAQFREKILKLRRRGKDEILQRAEPAEEVLEP